MAKPAKITSLNLGMQTVGLAEFRADERGGMVLQRYSLTELLGDPAADASRLGQIGVAVQDMAAAMRLKNAPTNYAVAAQSVFTRFVKLPPVDEEKVEQIIGFEAQQNVPFPIDEVVWDYQLVDSGIEGRIEVVLAAIKSDLLEDLNGAVEGAGLRTSSVDLAPMALYNAFRYNYSEYQDCSLIIDIGARTTNLVFIEPKKVFTRSIPIGGATITAAIAKDFEESFVEAEQRKKRDGFVSLGGAYAEPSDPDVARVSKVIRGSMTRLHAEVSRSISFYRAQQQGNQPQRVFLCGGSASLPYMREFFAEKLNLPIDYFNALRNVAIGPDVDATEAGKSAHVLGELVGLGLRATSDCPMELDLCPASVTRRQELATQRPYLVMAGICLWLALIGAWFYFFKAASVEQGVLDGINPKVVALEGLKGRMDTESKALKAAQEAARPFTQVAEDRQYWLSILDDLNARIPAKSIWVTGFELGDAGPATPGAPAQRNAKTTAVLKLHGLYIDKPDTGGQAVIDKFVTNLSQSPLYSKAEPKVRAVPNATDWAFDYEIQLELKTPIKL
jgi:type IV pilus assembly protein PilM